MPRAVRAWVGESDAVGVLLGGVVLLSGRGPPLVSIIAAGYSPRGGCPLGGWSCWVGWWSALVSILPLRGYHPAAGVLWGGVVLLGSGGGPPWLRYAARLLTPRRVSPGVGWSCWVGVVVRLGFDTLRGYHPAAGSLWGGGGLAGSSWSALVSIGRCAATHPAAGGWRPTMGARRATATTEV